jgi:hypothetical protein
MIKKEITKISKSFFKKTEFYDPPLYEGFKAYRAQEIDSLTVSYGGYTFEANERAMDRMDRVVDIANWEFNKAVSQGMPPANAYATVYEDTYLPWKMTDDTINSVTVETICNAQRLALNELANVWVKYG